MGLVNAMGKDIQSLVQNHMAMDAADPLTVALRDLRERWVGNFDHMQSTISEAFAHKALGMTDIALKEALRKGGFSVQFQMTPAMEKVLKSKVVKDNARLITNIPEKHFADVHDMIMQSAKGGRKLGELTDQLQERLEITRRRASLIARDQNNKATAAFRRVRQIELGLFTAKWLHTAASVHPREEHEGWDGKVYDVREGMYSDVDEEQVWPGTPVNCGCVDAIIVPGYDDDEEAEPVVGDGDFPGHEFHGNQWTGGDYSKNYWDAHAAGAVKPILAMHETFAEIHLLANRYGVNNLGNHGVKPAWRAAYKAVIKHYAEVTK